MRRTYHATFKAIATHTDQGLFTAVISTEAVDRENDVVVASAMVTALRAWTETGKVIPLAWNHSSDPEDIVGHIDPDSVKEVDGEVVASGWVDQDIPRGAETWRLMKSGTLGFSFGYKIDDSIRRADGVREIRKLDVFEISATPTPMNHGTRVLSTKSSAVPTDAELRKRAKALGIAPPLSKRELRQHTDDVRLELATGMTKSELRRLSKTAEREGEQRDRELRELRRRSRDARLEAALGFDADLIARAKAANGRHKTDQFDHASADLDEVRAKTRDHMLALLTEPSPTRDYMLRLLTEPILEPSDEVQGGGRR